MNLQVAQSEINESQKAIALMDLELKQILSRIEKDQKLITQSSKETFDRKRLKKDILERLCFFEEHPDQLKAMKALAPGYTRQIMHPVLFIEHNLSKLQEFVKHLLDNYEEKTIEMFADEIKASAVAANSLTPYFKELLCQLDNNQLQNAQKIFETILPLSHIIHESIQKMGAMYLEHRVQQCFPRKQDQTIQNPSSTTAIEEDRVLPQIKLFGARISKNCTDHCVGDKVNLTLDMDLLGDLSKGVLIEVSGSSLAKGLINKPESDPFALYKDDGDFILAYVRLACAQDNPDTWSEIITHPDFKEMSQWKLRVRYSVLSKALKEGSGTLKIAICPVENPEHGCEREVTLNIHGLEKQKFVEREQKLGVAAGMILQRCDPHWPSISVTYGITQEDAQRKAEQLRANKWWVREKK